MRSVGFAVRDAQFRGYVDYWSPMMWFETLTGFREERPQQVRENITVDGQALTSHVNGRVLVYGQLETPTLAELRERVHASGGKSGKISAREVVANVQDLHTNVSNVGSVFRSPPSSICLKWCLRVTPECGVGIYEHDCTQGPACAIAAGAGTIYRNYFADVNGQTGQSANNQIDCLADVGAALGNTENAFFSNSPFGLDSFGLCVSNRLWKMRNGYAMASQSGLVEIAHRLRASSEIELDRLRKLLRIGIQWNTQVTLNDSKHTVSQAYCSALPVAYSHHPSRLWTAFARLVLEAAYEATICTAFLSAMSHGSNKLFLTLLGDGAFGNETAWIIGAIHRALNLYKDVDLDVAIVSYGSSNYHVQQLVNQ